MLLFERLGANCLAAIVPSAHVETLNIGNRMSRDNICSGRQEPLGDSRVRVIALTQRRRIDTSNDRTLTPVTVATLGSRLPAAVVGDNARDGEERRG